MGICDSSPHPKNRFGIDSQKNQLFDQGSTLAIHMTEMQLQALMDPAFIRPCAGNRDQFLIPKYFPRAPQKLQLPHAICGSGVLIFGGRGGSLRTIAGARPYKSRIHQHFKLQIGHMSQIDVVPWQGAPKIDKNIDSCRFSEINRY